MVMELVRKIASFIRKLSGIRWFIIIDPKTSEIIDKSDVLTDKDTESLVRIALDSANLLKSAGKYSLLTRGETGTQTIFVKYGGGEGLEVESVEDKIYVLNIDEKLLSPLSGIFDKLRRGESIKCSNCGHDLTLETYTCPKCGRTIPFLVDKCPFCGYDLRIKKCPNCGKPVNISGKVIGRDWGLLGFSIGLGILIAGFTTYLGITLPALYKTLFTIIGIIIGGAIIGLGYKASTP